MASTTIEGAITGVAIAYDNMPSGSDLPLPCFINMPYKGTIGGLENEWEFMGSRLTTHEVKTQLLCSLAQTDLIDAEKQARPFLRRFVTTIDRFKRLNATPNIHDAMVRSYEYGYIHLRDGDPGYLGWTFIVRVMEIEENIVYTDTGPAI